MDRQGRSPASAPYRTTGEVQILWRTGDDVGRKEKKKRSRSDLLLEMVEGYMNRRSASQTEDRMNAKLDRLAREVSRTSNECVVISHSLYRFIRHQLIYAAALPAPGEDARALGEKRFQAFLDSVAQVMAKGADNDNEPPEADKVNEA
jgi:hypothetical protein